MTNHTKTDLRMGGGLNWFMIISKSVPGKSGSATECHYRDPQNGSYYRMSRRMQNS